ncbi:MAG: hypothetical protein ACK41U_01150 [Paracoccus sp. (in: a-proteobacteria)]|uniref:hypothetical protein n=1 Tax=Paracoccus sp. TaxID=267 RepID=UPI00391C5EE3
MEAEFAQTLQKRVPGQNEDRPLRDPARYRQIMLALLENTSCHAEGGGWLRVETQLHA